MITLYQFATSPLCEKVRRILNALSAAGVYASGWSEGAVPVDWGAHRELALEAAQQAIVLLHSTNHGLTVDLRHKRSAYRILLNTFHT